MCLLQDWWYPLCLLHGNKTVLLLVTVTADIQAPKVLGRQGDRHDSVQVAF